VTNRLKQLAVYTLGFIVFSLWAYHAFGISPFDDWRAAISFSTLYFIANLAGDLEARLRAWLNR
jgi:hypothetical protein